ncbi:MAG: hypothetical protein LC797_18645 [Chloroflexi bacterium]|nr:hypothetical protein [Chloroflexota bacterium]
MEAAPGRGAVFEIDGVPAAGLDAFGIWKGVGGAIAAPVWRASWNGDVAADPASLADADARLRRSSDAMEVAELRLDRHVRQSTVSAVYGVAMRAPEATLSALIHTSTGASDSRLVTYGLPDISSAWSRVVADFSAMLATAGRMLGDLASVETLAAGRLFGRTVVSWTGTQVTVWPANPSNREVLAHIRVLDLAIRTRAAFLRMVAVVARAARVLTSLATPLGPLLALPAAWKFVDEVVRELNWLKGRQ